MPRGNPKRKVMLRLDPRLIDEVKEVSNGNFTQTVELALQAWVKRARRNALTGRLMPKPTDVTSRQ
jgi:hypothetical protein